MELPDSTQQESPLLSRPLVIGKSFDWAALPLPGLIDPTCTGKTGESVDAVMIGSCDGGDTPNTLPGNDAPLSQEELAEIGLEQSCGMKSFSGSPVLPLEGDTD